jgi:DMSO/TMAO reductase YedYZ molybdopterin-dependent catalytic subunit
LDANENRDASRKAIFMLKTSRRSIIGIIALAVLAVGGGAQAPAPATTSTPALVVTGAVKQESHLTRAELKAMPRTKISAKGHDGITHEYEGVALRLILTGAGVPQTGDLRGKNMTLCVMAQAADGYGAVFSLAELDADFAGEAVIVADTVDGKDLSADQGPLRLVVPGDKRQGRWVRLLKALSIVDAGG